MKYGTIPYVKQNVSRLIFGTMVGSFPEGENEDDLLDAALAMGINTFDLARVYGKAEETFGNWMEKRQNRNKLVILTKCGHPSSDWEKRINEAAIRSDFEESTRLLHTDYIDIYILHRDDPSVPAGEIVEWFNAMHAEGKIGAFGGSNWTHTRIEEANEYAYVHNLIPFSVSSPNFSLAKAVNGDVWGGGSVSITGEENQEARDWYGKHDMPVIAYSSLAHGFLSGKLKYGDREKETEILDPFAVKGYSCDENYERLRRCEELAKKKNLSVAQIALAWLFVQDLNVFAAVGSSKKERMEQNAAAVEIQLTKEEAQYLNLERDQAI